jgi:cobalt-zinc-cadmium efflux system outer membrane protein
LEEFVFLLAAIVFAQSNAWALSPNDVLQKIRERSPEATRLEQLRESALNESKAIRRWLNPVFTSQSLFSKFQSDSRSQIQLAVLQPIEFGARASFKSSLAEALSQRAQADYEWELGALLIQAGRDLFRLQQLKEEQSAIRESMLTYQKLIQQYQSRPRLSPEQEVSLSVYQLSRNDFLIREEAADREEEEIYARLKAQFDVNTDELKTISTSSLNLLNLKAGEWNGESPRLQIFDAEVKSSEAQVSLERAAVFSEIEIGPMFQMDTDGSQKAQWYGFQLTFPLPIWNQNGSGIDSAIQKRKAAEINRTVQTASLHQEVKLLTQNLSRYQTLLKQIPDSVLLETRHKKVEAQIYRGLVTSALVVESHRSMIEIQQSRHEIEMNLLTSIWKIYQIQGKSKEIQL